MLDVVSINDYANFGQNPFIRSQDTDWKRNILMSFRGHNCVTNRRKWTFNNPKQDVVNTNAPAQFSQIPTPDIERKRNSDIIQGP